MKNTNSETASTPSKTFLVTYGTTTIGFEDHRDHFSRGLVEAKSIADAEKIAFESHCPEAFQNDGANGEWPDLNALSSADIDGPTIPGGRGCWLAWQGHRAFQFGNEHSDVDQGCIFWIEAVVEVPEEDAVVLRKYHL